MFVEALLADGSSDVVPSAELIIVPTAQTDLIDITKATMSKSGTLTVTAVSENPDAVLTAEFNGQPVPWQSSDGKFRGQLVLSQATSGIVMVTSQFRRPRSAEPARAKRVPVLLTTPEAVRLPPQAPPAHAAPPAHRMSRSTPRALRLGRVGSSRLRRLRVRHG